MIAVYLCLICIALPGAFAHFIRNAHEMNEKEKVRETANMYARCGQFGLAEKYMEEHFG